MSGVHTCSIWLIQNKKYSVSSQPVCILCFPFPYNNLSWLHFSSVRKYKVPISKADYIGTRRLEPYCCAHSNGWWPAGSIIYIFFKKLSSTTFMNESKVILNFYLNLSHLYHINIIYNTLEIDLNYTLMPL